MISEVTFRNFKALRDVTTSLQRLSVFVGPNASGKTSILEGIHFVAQSMWKDPPSIFIGPRTPALLFSGQPNDNLAFSFRSGHSELLLHVWPNGNYEKLGRGRYEESPLEWHAWADLSPETDKELSRCGSAVFLRLEASRLAAPSYSARETPRVEFDGDGLASTLLYMKGNNEEAFANVEETLQRLVPTVKKIRFQKSKVYRKEVDYLERDGQRTPVVSEREYMGDSLIFDTASGTQIPAQLMSEGTLLLLGMLTILHGPQQPRIVLIDDIDRALHPRAQRQFVELLRQWLSQRNDLQIIATTHSPYLLDVLQAEEVGLTTLNDEGFVVCAPLSRHPDFPRWKDEMSPGEFWSAVGEDWVREQAASEAAR